MSAIGSILTNSGALSALNSIAQTSQTTNQLQNELASGLSISSPSDNPAGYITAQGFTSQINGLTQATSNANQGVSLLQTAQSAIGQQIGVVQQLNSIAVQAANGTQTASESQSLQNLVGQLTSQVSTIATQTAFNNINLLDGSFSGMQFQVGANEGQTLSLSINSTAASGIGMNTSQADSSIYNGTAVGTKYGSGSGAVSSPTTQYSYSTTGTLTGTVPAHITFEGQTVTLTGVTTASGVATAITTALSGNGNNPNGVTVSANGSQLSIKSNAALTTLDMNALTSLGLTAGSPTTSITGAALGGGTATITGYNGGNASITTVNGESAAEIAESVNAKSAQTGVEAQANTSLTFGVNSGEFAFTLQAGSVDGTGASKAIGNQISVSATTVTQAVSQINSNSSTTGIVASEDKSGNLVISQTAGQNISVGVTSGTLTTLGGTVEDTNSNFLIQGQVQLQSAGGFSVTDGTTALGVGGTSALQSLNSMDVSTSAGANKAINIVKYALQGLNNQDGQLGAVQQRMTATIANLSSTSTNATTALGVVQDANIPAVANQLTQAQIQAQSGVAALKSSTELQQTYLSLLP